VPVTIYVLVAAGAKATPLITPLFHEYAIAPLALSTTVFEGQTLVDELVILITGVVLLTVTLNTEVSVQPMALIPVTVKF
jgi:hypothetical protein